jgi:magnesium-transporting ATPase (P-type)
MLRRALSISLAALTLTATVVAASTLTERLEASRMTVLKVDAQAGRFLCVEHQRWTPVVKADAKNVEPGDIVRVTRQEGKPARLVVLRTAADEIASPER